MKKYFFLLLFTGLYQIIYSQERLYVSPEGNDHATGSIDSPYPNIQEALKGKLGNQFSDTLYIDVKPGDYYLSSPILINQPTSRPVIIRSTSTTKPRLLGGFQIKNWEAAENGIYKAFIPEVKSKGFYCEQFYVNGKKATLAQTPNKDWFEVEKSSETAFVKGLRAADYAVQKIYFKSEDLSSLKDLTDDELKQVKLRFYHKWDITQKHIDFFKADSNCLFISGEGMKPWNPITKGSRCIISNYRAALDQAGEWYLDRKEGYIYYKPLPGEDMNSAECFVPGLHQLVVFKGESGNPVKNIRFENISFQYSSYLMPQEGDEPMQAAASKEAALEMDFAENIVFDNCEIMHTGSYALWLRRECHHNKVEHCFIADVGAGGIKIGEPYFRSNNKQVTSFNIVNNSIITHAGTELPCGVGIAIFHASDNQITHNEISDLRYSGVSIGWVWGYNSSSKIWTTCMGNNGKIEFIQQELTSPAVRNHVEYNHIHHIGWGELSDMGAVYTLGESHGTTVSNNVIHDILSYDYGGWGLYTDEGSTGVEMKNNLVYRCKSGGFHQHYGKENHIENNIFAFGHYYQVQYTRPEPHLSFHFKHNIILKDKGETLAGPWDKGNIDMDYNLYWNTNGDVEINKGSFKDWKKIKDKHSIVADPLFKDPLNDNFDFKSLKNARKIKFKSFDFSKAGVYGSETWKTKANLDNKTLLNFKKAASVRLKK